MKKIFFWLVLGATAVVGLSSCTPKSKELESLTEKYYEQYLQFHPLEATSQGDERYNDLLPIDISTDFIEKEKTFYKDTEQQLQNIDYKNLSDEDKIVYAVLQFKIKDYLEGTKFHSELIPFSQFDGLPLQFPLLGSGAGSQPFKTIKNYNDWLKRMDQFPKWMEQAKKNFQKGMTDKIVLPKSLVEKMVVQMQAEELTSKSSEKNIFYGPIKNFPNSFSSQDKEDLTKQNI